MGNNNAKALRSGLWYTISNFLMKSIGLITTPIFTRLLTQEEFGYYNNYVSWLAILTIIVTLNLESTFISARYDYKKTFDEYILSVLALSTLSGIIWIVICNCFSEYAKSILSLDTIYINCMLLYMIFLSAINMYQTRERYFFEYRKSVFISVLVSISTTIISVLFVLLFSDRLFGRIIGSAIPTIIIGFFIYILIFYRGKRIVFSYWKYALAICIPYIPHLLSLNVLNSMDKVMITRICGTSDNALYSLAYTCGHIVTLLMTSMNGAFSPWLGECLSEKKYSDVRKFSNLYVAVFSFFAIGLMLISPEILLIMGGRAYLEAKYVMVPVALGCVCQFVYTLFVNVEQFEKKTVGMAIASLTAALLNYGLNLLFIPNYGYIAAAYTTLAGYVWLLVFHMILVAKMKRKEVYNYSFLIGVILLMFVISFCINVSFSLNAVRYLFIIAYIIIFLYLTFKYKEEIRLLLRRLIKSK